MTQFDTSPNDFPPDTSLTKQVQIELGVLGFSDAVAAAIATEERVNAIKAAAMNNAAIADAIYWEINPTTLTIQCIHNYALSNTETIVKAIAEKDISHTEVLMPTQKQSCWVEIEYQTKFGRILAVTYYGTDHTVHATYTINQYTKALQQVGLIELHAPVSIEFVPDFIDHQVEHIFSQQAITEQIRVLTIQGI